MKKISQKEWLDIGRKAGWIRESKSSGRPPKKWFDEKLKEVKEESPDYNDEEARAVVGDIWYHKISDSKKSEIIDEYEGEVNKKEE